MKIKLSLFILVIFAVLQIRTDNPVNPEEQIELTKRFSSDELKRARDAGLSDRSIIRGTSNGWTLEEMTMMISMSGPDDNFGVFMRQFCKVLFPNRNETTLTSAQEINLKNLYEVTMIDFLGESDQRPFLRTIVCAYLDQPDLFDADVNSFGSEFVLSLKIRYMKTKVQNALGAERARGAKWMCCLYQGENIKKANYAFNYPGTILADEDLNDFNKHWSKFESTNTSKALENVCDFLNAKIPFKKCPEYVFW